LSVLANTFPECLPGKERPCPFTKKLGIRSSGRHSLRTSWSATFTPTAEELEFANKGARSNGSRLTLLTLLKFFQALHRFPAPTEVPPAIVQHIRIHLGMAMT